MCTPPRRFRSYKYLWPIDSTAGQVVRLKIISAGAVCRGISEGYFYQRVSRDHFDVLATILAGAAAVSVAQASSLIGIEISASYAYPCVTCTNVSYSYFANPFVATEGPSGNNAVFPSGSR